MARPKQHTEPRVSTAVRLPADLHERLQVAADERDTSINHLIVKASSFYLDHVLAPLEPVVAPRGEP